MKFIDIFFPPVCPICFGHAGKAVLCGCCEDNLRLLEFPGEKYVNVDGKRVKVHYLYKYGSRELTRYIFALKKSANKDIFSHAADKLFSAVLDMPIERDTVITNVPRRKVNVRLFGYDHSKQIAKFLAKQYENVLRYEKLLKRRGFSRDQKDLDAASRVMNASGKYKAVVRENVERIILFDDVITTASSFAECVRELRLAYGNDIDIVGLFLASTNTI